MWLKICLLYLVVYLCKAFEYDPSTKQLSQFKNRNPSPVGILTTLTGSPVTVNETISLNSNLLLNKYVIETITHFDGERTAERLVHAKAAGAFGYFEVTHDITDVCRADFLKHVGKVTPVGMRLSTMTGSKSSIDTTRDPRGYAVKFYTQEGNWDMLGLSSPMIVFKDPVQFPSFIHSQKPNPKTGLIDFGMRWDYRSLRQESLHGILYISSDYGIFDVWHNF